MRRGSFDKLLPAGVAVVEATDCMWTGDLYPIESQVIANAVEKRRQEFTAGRNCARAALVTGKFVELRYGLESMRRSGSQPAAGRRYG